jgi:leader peptidase (prepilin peptidase)/N-methyltransferase
MHIAAAAFAFAPALAIGSFLNVVAARLPMQRSIVQPRSACQSCQTELRWQDNIPIVSYLALGGRCRTCGEHFSVRYPLVELTTALLVAACFLRYGLSGQAIVGAFFVSVLVVLSAIDIEHLILPDKIVLPSFVIVLVANIAFFPDRTLEWVIAALGASLFLFLALLAYPRGMGMGDVKLALLLGAALGWTVAVGMLIGMIAAVGFGTLMMMQHGLEARKKAIPFGPFLAFGAIVAYFAGDAILNAYAGTF